MDKAGCPSGLLTAGGSAPEEQQSKNDVELPAPGTGSVRSSSLGRMAHGHGHSDAGDDGCRNRHLFHSRDRQLGLNARTPLLLMDGGLMLWKRMELSHLGRMKRYHPPLPPERWKTSTRVWMIREIKYIRPAAFRVWLCVDPGNMNKPWGRSEVTWLPRRTGGLEFLSKTFIRGRCGEYRAFERRRAALTGIVKYNWWIATLSIG